MSIETTNFIQPYPCNGVSTEFPTGFPFQENSDISCTLTNNSTGAVTDLVQGVDYTVTGAGVGSGGTVTTAIAQPIGNTLTIIRTLPITQGTSFISNAATAQAQEAAFDKLTMIAQQIAGEGSAISLALKFPSGDTANPMLPSVSGRAGFYLGFDLSGNVYCSSTIGQNKGYWATGINYSYRDLVIDPTTQNVYTATSAYTSGSSLSADITNGYLTLFINMAALVAAVNEGITFDVSQYAALANTTSASNVFTATVSSALTSYISGIHVQATFANGNNGACTLNVNNLGAKAIHRNGSACIGGEMVAGGTAYFIYDGTYFNLVNPATTGGTVSSVSYTGDNVIYATGPTTPVTSAGTLTPALNTQTANTFLRGPDSGSAATPTFGPIVPADLPVATTTSLGAVSTDGNTIVNNSGSISVAIGSAIQYGALAPDGNTITSSSGILTANVE